MAKIENSPFQSNARVAICIGWGRDEYREDFVERVYKNGNFTLRSAPTQQWRPCHPYNGQWSALKTGDQWSRVSLELWTAETDEKITSAIAATQRRTHWRAALQKVNALRDSEITDAMVDQLRAIVPVKATEVA